MQQSILLLNNEPSYCMIKNEKKPFTKTPFAKIEEVALEVAFRTAYGKAIF